MANEAVTTTAADATPPVEPTTPERAAAVQAALATMDEATLRAVCAEMTSAYVDAHANWMAAEDAHANWMAAEDANRQFEEANNAMQEQIATLTDEVNNQKGAYAERDGALAEVAMLRAELEQAHANADVAIGELRATGGVKLDSMGIPKPAGLD